MSRRFIIWLTGLLAACLFIALIFYPTHFLFDFNSFHFANSYPSLSYSPILIDESGATKQYASWRTRTTNPRRVRRDKTQEFHPTYLLFQPLLGKVCRARNTGPWLADDHSRYLNNEFWLVESLSGIMSSDWLYLYQVYRTVLCLWEWCTDTRYRATVPHWQHTKGNWPEFAREEGCCFKIESVKLLYLNYHPVLPNFPISPPLIPWFPPQDIARDHKVILNLLGDESSGTVTSHLRDKGYIIGNQLIN